MEKRQNGRIYTSNNEEEHKLVESFYCLNLFIASNSVHDAT
jgi:hypothetical protein